MKLKEVHPDVVRYLYEDCYDPYEVYDTSGLFFNSFYPNVECNVVAKGNGKVAVVASAWDDGSGSYAPKPEDVQVVVFYTDKDNPDKVVDSCRFDATDNNVDIAKLLCELPELVNGRKLDKYGTSCTETSLEEVLSMADTMIAD